MKRLVVVSLVIILAIIASPFAYSDSGYKKLKEKVNLEEKMLMKVHMIMKNQEELNLSEDQIESIKNLKVNTKKELIKKNAEIDILCVDIKSKLWEEIIDIKEINKLVDKKYALKKEKTKSLIAACAKIKKTLSKEQKQNLKKLMQESFKCKIRCKKRCKN